MKMSLIQMIPLRKPQEKTIKIVKNQQQLINNIMTMLNKRNL